MKRLLSIPILLFILLPLFAVLYLSLVEYWSFPVLFRADFTGRWWGDLLQGRNPLLYSLGLSLGLSAGISVLATVFGFLSSRFLLFGRGREAWVRLAFYPYLIAPVVLGFMLQFYFVRMGLTGTLAGVFLAQALFVMPYSVLLLSTFWTEEVRQLAAQAQSLGASSAQVNRTILLPMARPWILLCLVQCFLISWFEYGITQLIGLGKVETLTIQAMNYTREASPHLGALSACLMIFPVLLLLLINQRLLLKRA